MFNHAKNTIVQEKSEVHTGYCAIFWSQFEKAYRGISEIDKNKNKSILRIMENLLCEE